MSYFKQLWLQVLRHSTVAEWSSSRIVWGIWHKWKKKQESVFYYKIGGIHWKSPHIPCCCFHKCSLVFHASILFLVSTLVTAVVSYPVVFFALSSVHLGSWQHNSPTWNQTKTIRPRVEFEWQQAPTTWCIVYDGSKTVTQATRIFTSE